MKRISTAVRRQAEHFLGKGKKNVISKVHLATVAQLMVTFQSHGTLTMYRTLTYVISRLTVMLTERYHLPLLY